ncbi:MAG TPA: hypothetical protein VFS92_07255 [Planctomycetota bacterium]|nr:hypothetical protein [Planctomycetota bacterium]
MRPIPAAAIAAAVLLAGCRSPFRGLGPETGPPSDPERIGSAIHGWPFVETAWHGTTHRTDVLWPLTTVRESLDGPPPKPDGPLPLLVHGESPGGRRWGIRPLFDVETRTGEGEEVEDVDLLFPIVKWRTEPGSSLFEIRPLLFTKKTGSESRLLLLPLFAHSEDGERSSTFVFPSYFRRVAEKEQHTHLWPLWGRRSEGSWTKDWTLFPFLGWGRDADRSQERWEVDAPFPLVHFGRDGEAARTRILPLLWHESAPGKRTTVAFPFWWSIHRGEDRFDMVFPFHASWTGEKDSGGEAWLLNSYIRDRHGDETRTHLFAPLVGWMDAPDRWSAHLFPVLWLDRAPGASSTHLWPLFGHARKGGRTEVSTIYPFFTARWDDDSWRVEAPMPLVEFSASPTRSESRIWPLFWTDRHDDRRSGEVGVILARWRSSGGEGTDAEAESEFRVLLKLFESTSKGGRSTVALNPLFRHETNARGDVHWSCLFGLLARTRERDEVRWRVLWFL